MTVCDWFALCDHPADGVVAHPVLGDVPTCLRCALKLDLDLRPRVAKVTVRLPAPAGCVFSPDAVTHIGRVVERHPTWLLVEVEVVLDRPART